MEENAKVKGTQKVGGAGKRKNEGGSAASALPSFVPLYFRVRTFSIQWTRLSRSLEQATEGITSDYMLTIVNPESDAHSSFVNVVTVPLNVANAGKILRQCCPASSTQYREWPLKVKYRLLQQDVHL